MTPSRSFKDKLPSPSRDAKGGSHPSLDQKQIKAAFLEVVELEPDLRPIYLRGLDRGSRVRHVAVCRLLRSHEQGEALLDQTLQQWIDQLDEG